jgi:hypothetical protein
VRAFFIALLVAAAAALSACQIEDAAWGTVVSVHDVDRGEDLEDLAKYDDHPLVPEVGWEIVVVLDDGDAVTLTHNGARRYAPGERVRLLLDDDGALLL